MVPVTTVSNVLSEEDFVNFVEQIEESDLEFRQEYPKRLFSSPKHQDWLREVFGDFVASTAMPYCNAKALQQIFIGYELPVSWFSLHRSHPAIAGVAVISLDDFTGVTLNCLTDSFDNPDDYLWGQGEYKSENFEFFENSAIIVKNTDPRYHWGFSGNTGANQIKRSVWIYLGKEP